MPCKSTIAHGVQVNLVPTRVDNDEDDAAFSRLSAGGLDDDDDDDGRKPRSRASSRVSEGADSSPETAGFRRGRGSRTFDDGADVVMQVWAAHLNRRRSRSGAERGAGPEPESLSRRRGHASADILGRACFRGRGL